MSSDRKDPGSTWQGNPNTNWTQSPDSISSQHGEEQQAFAYISDSEDAFNASNPLEQDAMHDEEIDPVINSNPQANGLLQQLWQYITLIVFPMLFLGFTALLILPPVAREHLPLLSFWFIVVVLIIIAIGQGIAVYLAGPYHTMWVLGTLGGFVLFLLFGVFAVFGPLAGTLALPGYSGVWYLSGASLYSPGLRGNG